MASVSEHQRVVLWSAQAGSSSVVGHWKGAALAAFLIILFGGRLEAQVTGARIEGFVRDTSGAVLPGVEITTINQNTGLRRTSLSGDNGFYRVLALTHGPYIVRAELSGFKPLELTNILIEGSSDATVHLVMRVADLAEAVTVAGDLAVVPTDNTLRVVLGKEALAQLPISGRRVQDFALLTPAVGVDYSSLRAGNTDAISFFGLNERYKSMYVDGIDLNDELTGGGTVLTDAPRSFFSMESVAEFEVLKNNFSAEIGRNMTGVINIITKSGTNRFSGSTFLLWRDDAFGKPNYFLRDQGALPSRQWQGGVNFGGPLVRDRTHFFFAWERWDAKTSDFVSIPPALLNYLPDTRTEIPLTRKRDNFFLKLDHILAKGHNVSLTVLHDAAESGNQSNQPNSTGDARFDDIGRDWMVSGRVTSILGPRTVNEFRLSSSSHHERFSVENPSPNLTFPGIVAGTPTNLPQRRTQVPTVLGDVLSRGFSAAGNHFVKAGFEAVINKYPTNLNLFQFGQFVFGRAVPPGPDNPPVQYLLGQYAYDFADLDSRYFAFFVQDDWKIHPNVTLNLGLRWDLHQYRGTYSGEDFPDFASKDEAVRFLITTLPGGANASVRYRMRTDPKDLVQPRLGLAWDVFGNGRTAIRGGYGRFVRGGHDPISVTGVLRAERAQLFIAPGGVFDLLSFFPGRPSEQLQAQFFRASIVSQFPGVFVKDAFAHQASVSLEQRLFESIALGVDYSAIRARRVPRTVNLNHPDAEGRFPYLATGAPLTVQTADGVISSDIFTVRAERRFSARVGLTAWYTWMKSREDGPSTSPFLRSQDYGPVPNDVRHSAAISWTWELPYQIRISSITRMASAFPYNVTAGVDTTGDRVSTNDRPPGVPYNSRRGDSFFTEDLRVSKLFTLAGNWNVEMMGEVFNLFNTTNFISYVGSVASPSFGNPTQAAQPFQGQVGLRVRF